MVRISSIVLCLTTLLVAPSRAEPETAASQLGFGYCPPPIVPGCIAVAAARRPGASALAACNADVLRFTESLGVYRACLTRESERAIGTGNAAIARFRCIAQHGHGCR